MKSAQQLYREDVEHLGRGWALQKMVERKDKKRVICYFLPDVLKIAERYYREGQGPDYLDIVGAGNVALAEYVMGHSLRYATVRTATIRAIERGIKEYTLKETIDRFTVGYDSEEMSRTGRDEMGRFERGRYLEDMNMELTEVLGTLTERERQMIEMRYGLFGNQAATLEEMGGTIGTSRERARQIAVHALTRLQHPARFKRLQKYADMVESVDKKSRWASHEDVHELESFYEQAKRDIGRLSEMTMDDFVRHYNMSNAQFADFLSALYPRLEEREALRLVRLSEAERKRIERDDAEIEESLKDVKSIKKTLQRMGERGGKITQKSEIDIKDRLRELYMPLFASDKERCLSLLENEVDSNENSAILRGLFEGTYRYFSDIQSLRVEGVSTELDDFQKVDVEVLSRQREGIIGSEMGTGKSLEAICYALRKGLRRVLIVSTRSGAYATWPKELRRHLEGTPSLAVLDGQTFRSGELLEEASRAQWFVTTYNTATRYIDELTRMDFDLVVLDESHKINNANTEQSRALTMLNPPYKLAMSGSLFKNDRRELFPVLNWLFPEDFPNVNDFVRRYCQGDRGLYRLQFELRKRMIVRFKDDVLDLPAPGHFHEEVTLEGEAMKEYVEMENDFIEWLIRTGGEVSKDAAGHAVLQKLHGLRKKAIEPKTPLIDELLEHIIQQDGRKAVLYTTYVPVAERFRKRYHGYGVCYISGQTGNKERVMAIEEFGADPQKKLFVVTAAGGESIDLTPAGDLIYANKPLTYADERQMLDRLHRRGQTKAVRAFHITTVESVEEKIERLLRRKREEYERTVHGSFEFARWFEESESRNIRELVNDILAKEMS